MVLRKLGMPSGIHIGRSNGGAAGEVSSTSERTQRLGGGGRRAAFIRCHLYERSDGQTRSHVFGIGFHGVNEERRM